MLKLKVNGFDVVTLNSIEELSKKVYDAICESTNSGLGGKCKKFVKVIDGLYVQTKIRKGSKPRVGFFIEKKFTNLLGENDYDFELLKEFSLDDMEYVLCGYDVLAGLSENIAKTIEGWFEYFDEDEE